LKEKRMKTKRRNEVHVTERGIFKTCRRQWKYSELWGLKPKLEAFPFLFGTAMHRALEGRYRAIATGSPIDVQEQQELIKQVFKEETKGVKLTFETKQELIELRDLALQMILRYDQHWGGRDYTQDQILAVEEPLRIKVPGTNVFLCGKQDLVIKNESGMPAPVDHKTFKTLASDQQLYLDDQMTAYQWLLWKHYKTAPGSAIYNQLRKSVPKVPQPLKDGTRLSKQNIDTTWQIYKEAIKEHGFKVKDYHDMEKKLKGNVFFTRTEAPRTIVELQNFEKMLVAEVREMCSPKTVYYPHQDWDCTWRCDFTALCKCESEGGDVEGLSGSLYTREED
jgi:hypothetical protein